MLGIIVIVGVSWLLLHFFTKTNIRVLFQGTLLVNFTQFIIGLLFISVITLSIILLDTQVRSFSWTRSSELPLYQFGNAFWYHLKSALTEDLVFRGALLYILIQKIGTQKALVISAIAFGVYHWFSFGILGERIIYLIYVFLTTGFTGYSWAYTYSKTKSILMPLGFHLGSNFILTMFYESQPYGEMLYHITSTSDLPEWYSFFYSFFRGLLPGGLTLLFVYYLGRKKRI